MPHPTSSDDDRLHRSARFEDVVNRRVAHWLWARGWRTRIEPFTGYGAPGWVRVLARVVLSPPPPPGAAQTPALAPHDEPHRSVRGWRSLATAQVKGAIVEVRAGASVHRVTSDRGGYVDAVVASDLAPGWHDIQLTVATGSVTARVFVVDPQVRAGLVSDIDDTVMVTWAPRLLLAIWNTLVLHEHARRPVPGMSRLYQQLLREDPRVPVLYLSTGAWNAAPALQRFLRRTGYPAGPMLLTDWGPTNTGWFRRGADHKRASLRRLVAEFPDIRWLLVGDDGQRDPEIYAELAAERPDLVRAVAIRRLSGAEQTLARGAPVPSPDASDARSRVTAAGVPFASGPDGEHLGRELRAAGVDLSSPDPTD
ncbi:App1 family protein [Pengzhenrongella sicca]|uniref:DUF2183 domain-containing protein n=1 Tax=Pengzhenrongella sicca TaxID=2819238 RepID=A0A8A4Z7S4_9MICO|nr:phosphatase domain-containing protein [Pengzhenrongella sicca]QTE27864.1 DUF2183 domain-containing protein [Pengzhenrongella sicca]